MRTQDEIVERTLARFERDIFDFEVPAYLAALDAEHLKLLQDKGILKPDVDMSKVKRLLVTDEDVLKDAREYMEFAWEKANGCRGISASRSLLHYKAWMWLLGEDQFEDIEDYEYYGKDHLVRLCHYLGLDPNQWDDGVRTNDG